jgi:hypothetical protein
MRAILYSIVLLIISTSCLSQNETAYDKNKELKEVEKFKYPINNNDKNCFGYERMTASAGLDDEVGGLLIKDNYIYILDSKHGNMKKVNLSDGEIIQTSEGKIQDGKLDQIIKFNDNFIVFPNLSTNIYIISNNLKDLKRITVTETSVFYRKVEHYSDSLLICTSYIKERMKDSITYDAFYIDDKNNILPTTQTLPRRYFLYVFQYDLSYKSSKQYEENGKYYFQRYGVVYEIPELIRDFNWYFVSLALNDEYLIYIIKEEDYYEMTVCKY